MKLPSISAAPKPAAEAPAPAPALAKPAVADPAPEPAADPIPAQGGSYVRQPDGTLDRVEFTAHPEVTAEEPR